MFALDCNQFTVENWSEQFVRGLEVWGRPSVLGVPAMLLLASLHHASLPARTHTHTHSLPPLFLTIFEAPWHQRLPNHIHLSIYPLCKNTLSGSERHKLLQLWCFCCLCFSLLWTFLWQASLTLCFYNFVSQVSEERAEQPGRSLDECVVTVDFTVSLSKFLQSETTLLVSSQLSQLWRSPVLSSQRKARSAPLLPLLIRSKTLTAVARIVRQIRVKAMFKHTLPLV